jgi:FkbM family methyltransferase
MRNTLLATRFACADGICYKAMSVMPAVRNFAKSCLVLVLGRESRPRTIVRGLAAGYRMYVSPAENLGYLLGTYEPQLQAIIKEYVAAGDTVYDVGANVGYASLLLAKRVGPGGRVIAFEPVPRNIDAFRENVKINDLANVRLLEFAASDRRGEATIRVADNFAEASLVWHRNDPSAQELTIRTVAIDELVEAGDLAHPRFVKIDVEGAEGNVLRGMRRMLAAAKPILFVECSEAGRETAWNLLRELGYRCESAVTRKSVDSFEAYQHSDFLWLPANTPAQR